METRRKQMGRRWRRDRVTVEWNDNSWHFSATLREGSLVDGVPFGFVFYFSPLTPPHPFCSYLTPLPSPNSPASFFLARLCSVFLHHIVTGSWFSWKDDITLVTVFNQMSLSFHRTLIVCFCACVWDCVSNVTSTLARNRRFIPIGTHLTALCANMNKEEGRRG